MRKLIHIPTIHTLETVHPVTAPLFEDEGTRDEAKQLEDIFWPRIYSGVKALDASSLTVFLEGLLEDIPMCSELTPSRQKEIEESDEVKLLSGEFFLQYELWRKGARLVKTEDENLFNTCVFSVQKYVQQQTRLVDARIGFEPVLRSYRDRDRFIAEQIDRRLPQDQTGLLIVGALHDVQQWLPSDILVELLDPELDREMHEILVAEAKEMVSEIEDQEFRGGPERR